MVPKNLHSVQIQKFKDMQLNFSKQPNALTVSFSKRNYQLIILEE